MKSTILFLFLFVFSGCDLLETLEEKNKKVALEKVAFEQRVQEIKEVQLKTISAQTQKELAILESKKELAQIEKELQLEKIRMQAKIDKQKILLEQDKAKALFEQEMKQKEQMDSMELKRYFIIILGLFILLSLSFLFYYFKKRREDKLLAYNDNLQKYFYHKENEARVKIAEKMLDSISSGKLDKAQENQLISAFSGESKGQYQEQIELHDNQSEDIDVELIEKPVR